MVHVGVVSDTRHVLDQKYRCHRGLDSISLYFYCSIKHELTYSKLRDKGWYIYTLEGRKGGI